MDVEGVGYLNIKSLIPMQLVKKCDVNWNILINSCNMWHKKMKKKKKRKLDKRGIN